MLGMPTRIKRLRTRLLAETAGVLAVITGEDLKKAHEHLDGAGKDLATAVKDWREANGLKPEPKETPVKP